MNAEALILGVGFWNRLYYTIVSNKEPPPQKKKKCIGKYYDERPQHVSWAEAVGFPGYGLNTAPAGREFRVSGFLDNGRKK